MARRDYFTDEDRNGLHLDIDVPMHCNDCDRPTYYDYGDEAYHHAIDAERGCFLIAGEKRNDDHHHPDYEEAMFVALETSTSTFSRFHI